MCSRLSTYLNALVSLGDAAYTGDMAQGRVTPLVTKIANIAICKNNTMILYTMCIFQLSAM